jgi:hypothetical protein
MSIRNFAQSVRDLFSRSSFFKCRHLTEVDRSGDRSYNGPMTAALELRRIREIDRRVSRLKAPS